jgi:Icc-related predicted phosphoesterase
MIKSRINWMNLNKIKDFFIKYRFLIIPGVLILFLIISSFSYKKNSQIQENQNNTSFITPTLTQTQIPISEEGTEPGLDTGDEPLNYMLPHEEKDFEVIKYVKPKVLLVKAKTDTKTAKESLKKWLDLVEDIPGENIIVWQ